MTRYWLGLGLFVSMSAAGARGQDSPVPLSAITPALKVPAKASSASLGSPRAASLLAPRAANALESEIPSAVPIQFLPLRIRGQSPDSLLISAEETEPKKMPTPEIKEGPSLTPKDRLPIPKVVPTPVAPPMIAVPVNPGVFSVPAPACETPGCVLPQAAMPFVRDGNRFYGSSQYLMWWVKSYSVPVIATTGPVGSGGVIGQPGVVPILGGGNMDPTSRTGYRFNLGWWFGDCREWAVDTSFFFLGDRGTETGVNSGAYPLIARPFVSPNTLIDPANRALRLNIPGNFSEITSLPGVQMGGIALKTNSFMWGGDVALRRKWLESPDSRLDFLVGYRHMNFRESLEVTESFMGVPGGAANGLNGIIYDRFRTSNQFNGALVGLLYERDLGRWHLGVNTKLALGTTNSSSNVNGGVTQFGPNFAQTTVPGGLLALNSNLGNHTKDSLTFIPEVGVTVGYDVTTHCRVFVGYNFLYWSNLIRPGDQIDSTLDLRRVPVLNDPRFFPQINNVRGAMMARPAPLLRETDLWVQGVSWGMKFSW